MKRGPLRPTYFNRAVGEQLAIEATRRLVMTVSDGVAALMSTGGSR